ncbi:MAG: hypothetical protein MJ120_02950 [Clostridia bacterium]|nr:hypothetical protein [Clostridia bacterium]
MAENYKPQAKGVSAQELALINKLTYKELSADEVFSFSVNLCDNEIDRDGDCFDDMALEKLSELFIGITGIFDHVHSSRNQTARIYSAFVAGDTGRLTSQGKPYKALRAKAYMPKSEDTIPIMEKINAGILKEVSVCCSVENYTCSICGNDLRSEKCTHIKGVEYNGRLCYCILKEPKDAYEWSFVAIPAQPGAGVTKGFEKSKVAKTFSECEKSLKSGREILIDSVLSKKMGEKLTKLQKDADLGREYKNDITAQIIRYSSMILDDFDSASVKKMCETLDIDELKALRESLVSKAAELVPLEPQLVCPPVKAESGSNNEFIF